MILLRQLRSHDFVATFLGHDFIAAMRTACFFLHNFELHDFVA